MGGNQKGTSSRGFASMDQDKQRAIASKGGQSVPDEKRSFSQDPHLAAEAGRKGGQNVPPEKRSFSQNPSLAAEAGRKGGLASGQRRYDESSVTMHGGRVQAKGPEEAEERAGGRESKAEPKTQRGTPRSQQAPGRR